MRSLFFLIVLTAMLSCDTKINLEEIACYKCFVVIVTDYCAVEGGIDEIIMNEDEIRCDWTMEEIKQYEAKGFFTIDEKCFYRVQITRCYPWH